MHPNDQKDNLMNTIAESPTNIQDHPPMMQRLPSLRNGPKFERKLSAILNNSQSEESTVDPEHGRLNRQQSIFSVNLSKEKNQTAEAEKELSASVYPFNHINSQTTKKETEITLNIPYDVYRKSEENLILEKLVSNTKFASTFDRTVKLIGQQFPNGTFKHCRNSIVSDFTTFDVLKGKKVILLGVPGPYTPISSKFHLPPIISMAKEIKQHVDRIIVFSANTAFAMTAWQEHLDPQQELYFFADYDGSISGSLGLLFTDPSLSLYNSTMRCAIFTENGIIREMGVESKAADIDNSSHERVSNWFEKHLIQKHG